jgi:hypothetical protein
MGLTATAAVPEAPTPLTFASGDVEVQVDPEDVLLKLKRAREKAGHKDTAEALRRLPLAITVRSAGGSVEINLTGLNVVTLDVTTKDGSAEVTLPAEGDIRGTLRSGGGGITLYTPSSRSVTLTGSWGPFRPDAWTSRTRLPTSSPSSSPTAPDGSPVRASPWTEASTKANV